MVLIDFWTYSCINCIRTLPFLQTWHERYAGEGLVTSGCIRRSSSSRRCTTTWAQAAEDMGVAWPVVQDNNYAVWRGYSNRFWPPST